MSLADSARVTTGDDAVVREVNGETVLLNMVTSEYHVLDAVSTEMWHALLSAESFAAAVDAIYNVFDVDRSLLATDLERFVEELAERGLVRVESD